MTAREWWNEHVTGDNEEGYPDFEDYASNEGLVLAEPGPHERLARLLARPTKQCTSKFGREQPRHRIVADGDHGEVLAHGPLSTRGNQGDQETVANLFTALRWTGQESGSDRDNGCSEGVGGVAAGRAWG